MFGAIIGDVVGSVFEFNACKAKGFDLFSRKSNFTDDSVLTIATADTLLSVDRDYAEKYREYTRDHPHAGYGGNFVRWAQREYEGPYNSWGNGSAMRVSPVAYAFESVDEVLAEAKRSAEVTHNHPEGIKGAQATALAIFMARKGKIKDEIRTAIEERFNYDLSRKLDDIRKTYTFKVSCQESVPESIIAFLESENYVDAIRNAISLGGDADTQAAIAGSIAEPYYGEIPIDMVQKVVDIIPQDFITVYNSFLEKYPNSKLPWFNNYLDSLEEKE